MKKIPHRRFKRADMQRVYDLYRNREIDVAAGGDLAGAYKRGLGVPDKVQYERTSLAHAAWAAGVDHARASA